MLRDFLTCCSLAQSQQAARCPPQSVAACLLRAARRSSRTAMTTYPQKIAFGEMREMAARDVLIYSARIQEPCNALTIRPLVLVAPHHPVGSDFSQTFKDPL
jgi:hypothetical protein